MLVRPRPGQPVRLWYAAGKRSAALYHGRFGTVAAVAVGPGPRNHGAMIDGTLVVVPCGQLRKTEGA